MTAYDLYLMFHEALKYEKFRDIIGTKTYTGTYKGADGSDKTASWSVSNYYMLGKKEMPEGLSVFGGKTGTTQAAGTEIALQDSSGETLLTYAAPNSFSAVLVSCPEMTTGNTYTLTLGTTSQEITLTQVATTYGVQESVIEK